MAESKGELIDRRDFLLKSAFFFIGSLTGLNSFSEAFASSTPRIALIIDDIGHSRSIARQFLDLGVPITFAILPHLSNSYDLAMEIHGEGQEIILHQPMEPLNSLLDPGPGALYVKDGQEKIITAMDQNISSLPFIEGVNNHMGSKFTEHRSKMKEALMVIRKRGLFFIDSLTSCRSKAYQTARRLHLVTAYRNIFLDHHPDEAYILSQLHKLKNHARRYGHAIGIGHPHPETYRTIRHFLGGLKGSAISWVHVSRLLNA